MTSVSLSRLPRFTIDSQHPTTNSVRLESLTYGEPIMLSHHEQIRITSRGLSRRGFLHTVTASAAAVGTLNLRDLMSLQAAELKKQGKSMILLWMNGAPSQFETFDPKPDNAEVTGETKAIDTNVPGIQIANGWDNVAKVMNEIALIRSLTNKEGQHQRATFQMHTGYIPSSSVKYPSLGCNIAKMLGDLERDLPTVVSVGNTEGAGFLGVDYEPFVVDRPGEMPQNVAASANADRFNRRVGLLDQIEKEFSDRGGQVVATNHKQLYSKASKLVLSPEVKRFQFDDESPTTRDRYGSSEFGKGCLLARRMVESGVPFIEVSSRGAPGAGGNWDTHQDVFSRTASLIQATDPGMAALISDLKERGLLDRTLVVWMGEFGRTPRINPRGGRDHYPRVFNAAMAGCGIKGGQVIGASTKDGSAIDRDAVTVHDLFASICQALDVNPAHENISPLGRPIKIVDGGKPVAKLFA